MDAPLLEQALAALGATLEDRGLAYQIVLVGGSALLLTEEGQRPTQDADVIAIARGTEPLRVELDLPSDLAEAAADVADALGLDPDWLNTGPVGVIGHRLPQDMNSRLRHRTYGTLVVSVPARLDLVRLKLLAAADEGPASPHAFDLVRMGLTRAELVNARDWVNGSSPGGRVLGLDEVAAVLERSLR